MAQALEARAKTAKRWLMEERARGGNADVSAAAARVYESLFKSLAPVIGADAVAAMLVRSAKMTKGEYPCLGGILQEAERGHSQVPQQVESCLSKLQPEAAAEAATALYAALLGLMTAIIGERVTWQIVKSAFAEVAPTTPKEMP